MAAVRRVIKVAALVGCWSLMIRGGGVLLLGSSACYAPTSVQSYSCSAAKLGGHQHIGFFFCSSR